jgi:hypothetical protein
VKIVSDHKSKKYQDKVFETGATAKTIMEFTEDITHFKEQGRILSGVSITNVKILSK